MNITLKPKRVKDLQELFWVHAEGEASRLINKFLKSYINDMNKKLDEFSDNLAEHLRIEIEWCWENPQSCCDDTTCCR